MNLVIAQAQPAAYLLGPEDVLEVRLTNHPQLNRTVMVRPDGKITFPHIDRPSVVTCPHKEMG